MNLKDDRTVLSLLDELEPRALATVAPYVTDKSHSLGCRLAASASVKVVEAGKRALGDDGMACCPCKFDGAIGVVSWVDSDMNLRRPVELENNKRTTFI